MSKLDGYCNISMMNLKQEPSFVMQIFTASAIWRTKFLLRIILDVIRYNIIENINYKSFKNIFRVCHLDLSLSTFDLLWKSYRLTLLLTSYESTSFYEVIISSPVLTCFLLTLTDLWKIDKIKIWYNFVMCRG